METETDADIMLWFIPAVPWVIPLKPLLRGYLLLNCRELALRVGLKCSRALGRRIWRARLRV